MKPAALFGYTLFFLIPQLLPTLLIPKILESRTRKIFIAIFLVLGFMAVLTTDARVKFPSLLLTALVSLFLGIKYRKIVIGSYGLLITLAILSVLFYCPG